MITYRGTNGTYTLVATLAGDWEVLHDSDARENDGSRVGWHVVARTRTWRQAATWSNENLGTAIPIPEYRAVRGKLAHDDSRGAFVTCDGRPVASFWRFEEAVRYAAERNASAEPFDPSKVVPEAERKLWPEGHPYRTNRD